MSVPFHFEQVQTAGGVRAPGLFYSETLPKNPSLRARNRQQVIRVHDALCNRHDASVLDTDFAPGFIDHSPFMSGGLQGVREMLELLPDLHHEVVRVLADGDLVAIHGRYTGLGSTPLVGFDIYRLSGGRIVEHWAALAAEAAPNASGRTQLDGPTAPGRGDAEANRAFVVRHVVGTLFNANYSGFRFSTDGTRLLQHSPEMADGGDAAIDWHDALRTRGQAPDYQHIHRTVAEGQFVLTHSEARLGGVRHACVELWRIENGLLAEMWDLIVPMPEDEYAVHQNGVF